MFYSPKQRYARALSQGLHLLLYFLCDYDELNWKKKISGRHMYIYELIFKLGFRSIGIEFISYELFLPMFFSPRHVIYLPQ